ncbi:hypothetical protein [Gracilimonas tropica]|uniref:hypothetical protein n=1 Tax=Gracilimonas tropica TaxID=454600 RepID=UPI00035E36D4|nr:hypothetical protein [Gracilimonas tropica]
MDDATRILCEISEKLDGLQTLASRSIGGGEVTTLILPVTIGNNQPQRFSDANRGRVGLVIQNRSGSQLFIALAGNEVEVSEDYYSFIIEPDDHLILDQKSLLETYKGEVWGVWGNGAPADSRAMVTELSIEEAE